MTNIERNAKIRVVVEDSVVKFEDAALTALMMDISTSLASIADSLYEIKEMYGRTPDDRRI